MSAALISEPVWKILEDGAEEAGTFAHGFTYSGHPVGAAVALKNLEIMERERILENVQEVGPYLQGELRRRFEDHPLVGEVRGVGLVAGVQMVADKADYRLFDPKVKMAARVVAEGFEEGIILRSLATADAVAFSPALIITKAEIDRLLDGFAKALDRATDGLTDAERGAAGGSFSAGHPHPNPSPPGARGYSSLLPAGRRWPEGPDEGVPVSLA